MSARPSSPKTRTLTTLLLGLAMAAPSMALTPAEVFAKVSPSVWHVRTYDDDGMRFRQGSAVVVDKYTVVTNCHVLYNASRITLSQGKTRIGATLKFWDTERDICELRATELTAPAVELADMKRLAVGQPAYAIGSPLGLEQTLSAGLVSSLRKNDADVLSAVQTTAPVSSGSSGGGLFDEQGRLIGVTTWILGDNNGSTQAQNLNFAIPASYWVDLPERHAAGVKAVAAGKVDRLAKALELKPPSIVFTPAETMPANPETSTRQLADRVPHLTDQSRFRRDFLALALPRAFAVSDNGASGMASGATGNTPDVSGDPQQRALKLCERAAGKPCVIYVIDNEVLYQPPPGMKR